MNDFFSANINVFCLENTYNLELNVIINSDTNIVCIAIGHKE